MGKLFAAGAAAIALACVVAASAEAKASDTFAAMITSVTYSRYTGLTVVGYASFVDTDCVVTSICDERVRAHFAFGQGNDAIVKLITAADLITTGRSPWLNVRFAVPCRSIARHKSRYYTVVMTASAPNGMLRTVARSVSVPSCASKRRLLAI
jgi:hypothetical protein